MADNVLAVRIGGYRIGCPVRLVTEILSRPKITRVPRTAKILRGVSIVRGQPLAVWSIAPLLSLPQDEVQLVVRWTTSTGAALLAVDEVDRLVAAEFSTPKEAWQDLLSPTVALLVSGAELMDGEWLWRLSDDTIDQLQNLALRDAKEGVARAS